MGTWKIDPAHTDVSFSAKHMMITTVRGKFDRVEGALELDEAQPTRSRGEIRVGAASLSTGFEARDQHLRSADFFDVEKHEWIVVRATSVEPQDSGTYKVTADVTIRGETRPVTFDVAYLGTTPGMTGARHAGFSARAKVNRKDWGLNWNMALEAGGWLVGDEIKLDIEVAADEVGVTAAIPAKAATPVEPARVGAVA
jgi:polyisoprenoid-binding protein YceI